MPFVHGRYHPPKRDSVRPPFLLELRDELVPEQPAEERMRDLPTTSAPARHSPIVQLQRTTQFRIVNRKEKCKVINFVRVSIKLFRSGAVAIFQNSRVTSGHSKPVHRAAAIYAGSHIGVLAVVYLPGSAVLL